MADEPPPPEPMDYGEEQEGLEEDDWELQAALQASLVEVGGASPSRNRGSLSAGGEC